MLLNLVAMCGLFGCDGGLSVKKVRCGTLIDERAPRRVLCGMLFMLLCLAAC